MESPSLMALLLFIYYIQVPIIPVASEDFASVLDPNSLPLPDKAPKAIAPPPDVQASDHVQQEAVQPGPKHMEGYSSQVHMEGYSSQVHMEGHGGPGQIKGHSGPVHMEGHGGPGQIKGHSGPVHMEGHGGPGQIKGHGVPVQMGGYVGQMVPMMTPPVMAPVPATVMVIGTMKPPCYCTPRICNKCFIADGVPTQVIDNRGDTTIATSGSGITVQTNCDPQHGCLPAPACRPCRPGDTRYESCIYFGPGVNACTLGRAGFFGKK